jgi:hypothetical protein
MRRVYGGKVGAQYPGRSVRLPIRLPTSRGVGMNGQKSAEGIVAAAHGGEGPNMEDRKGYLLPRRTKETQAGWLRSQRTPGG